jgi:hypothetical protein
MTKLKHPGGRPTLYRREMCDRLVEAMAKGLTAEAAAARIGISARSGISPTAQQGEPAEIKAETVRRTNGDRAS